jgi:hypothetical protein
MKKSVLALAMAFGVTGAFAQDLTSKKGEPYLPEAGDWSIGIDATPFLNYAGQFFSNAGASAPTWNHLNSNNTIVGKMYKDEKTAYRAIVRLGMTSKSWEAETAKPMPSTTPAIGFPTKSEVVTDELKSTTSFIGLGGGIEMRRGKTRLQGYYGGDAMFWMSGSKDKYTYGNALTQGAAADPNVDPVADSHDWSGTTGYSNLVTSINNQPGVTGARITEAKNRSGAVIGFGVRGFIGAEYFVLPKLSIGAEFGWGIGIVANKKTTITYEAEGTNTTPAEATSTITTETKNGKTFTIDTDRNMFGTGTGSLRMNLHF